MNKGPRIHGRKPVQPHGRKAELLTMCGLKGNHHRMAFSAGNVTCGRCRAAMLKQLRAEVRA